MPELPEVEAWRRALNDPVSAFPVEKAGPAHIATLKTFDPPLSTLEGRRFAGAERRAKRLLFPTEDGGTGIGEAHALVYPPTNPGARPLDDERPPLLRPLVVVAIVPPTVCA